MRELSCEEVLHCLTSLAESSSHFLAEVALVMVSSVVNVYMVYFIYTCQ